jgi:hypothetical protein
MLASFEQTLRVEPYTLDRQVKKLEVISNA